MRVRFAVSYTPRFSSVRRTARTSAGRTSVTGFAPNSAAQAARLTLHLRHRAFLEPRAVYVQPLVCQFPERYGSGPQDAGLPCGRAPRESGARGAALHRALPQANGQSLRAVRARRAGISSRRKSRRSAIRRGRDRPGPRSGACGRRARATARRAPTSITRFSFLPPARSGGAGKSPGFIPGGDNSASQPDTRRVCKTAVQTTTYLTAADSCEVGLFRGWRRGRDSNPRYGFHRTHAFQACDLNHSSTSPWARVLA